MADGTSARSACPGPWRLKKIIAPVIGQPAVRVYISAKFHAASLLVARTFIALKFARCSADNDALHCVVFSKTGTQQIDRAADIVAQRRFDSENGSVTPAAAR